MKRALATCLILWLVACGARSERPQRTAIDGSADPKTWEVVARDPNTDEPTRVRDPRSGITFVVVPAGSSPMGGKSDIDGPVHEVTISEPFLLAETEVTIAQWNRYDAATRGSHPPRVTPRDEQPMSGIDWDAAAEFCELHGYSLPTEAQWEYAARAASSGDAAPWRTRERLEQHGWVYTNSEQRAWPVAHKAANAFGLFDMLGNVWEWCADHYAAGYADAIPTGKRTDPQGPPAPPDGATSLHVIRGGSWLSTPAAWPSDRQYASVDTESALIGFRPACAW
ncbi:MAG: SUMF1/EgtB/PvdO family nonheme iron enzyme [Planctomycetes bacterium]|nr:SUMF1/EgtB/PvdO family nonheme iron enzyme [Planctomycetota bacterium]